jgi:hypothetical protein
MAEKGLFYASKGCVYIDRRGDSQGYKLDPQLSSGDNDYPILLRNASLSDSDVVLPVSTLDSKKILYTFGRAFGEVVIAGTVFLGPAGSKKDGLQKVINYFEAHGVGRAEKPAPVTFSMPGTKGYKIFLTGLRIMEADPDLNLHNFQLIGMIAETS